MMSPLRTNVTRSRERKAARWHTGADIVAIDLFCGAGGLSHGLARAGVSVVAGVDLDPACRYPFEVNLQEAVFVESDVGKLDTKHLLELWDGAEIRLLAGCAPCTPFSPYRRGVDTTGEEKWPLLDEFGRLVSETLPELVTMENVPRIRSAEVFDRFVNALHELDYHVDWRTCHGPAFGLAQRRRRLVLLASQLGSIQVPSGTRGIAAARTVRDEIAALPAIESGGADPTDPLHRSRRLSPLNLERIRASIPGGSWEQWPEALRAPCHRRASGSTFRNVYSRMEWDEPAPTITTLAHNFGTGRFGHPEQDRTISLREAAMLQGFPRDYHFIEPDGPAHFAQLGRLIGNAVPPPLAEAVGRTILRHVDDRRLTASR